MVSVTSILPYTFSMYVDEINLICHATLIAKIYNDFMFLFFGIAFEKLYTSSHNLYLRITNTCPCIRFKI